MESSASRDTPGEGIGVRTNSGLSPADIRAELDRIVRSSLFVRSERLSRFLNFAVEETIEGRAHEIKEYVLGIKVFDRSDSFDPRNENIVRVEARRLRSALIEYYATTGREDPVSIEFPKGSYAPVFIGRQPTLVPTAAQQHPSKNSLTRRSLLWAAGLLLAGTLTYVGIRWERRRTSAGVGLSSIAVLPFANLTGDPNQEYFADGLTDEIINALTKVPQLHVVARTSSFQFKGKSQDIRRVAEQLNASVVLDGSVRKAGIKLRITAQLIQAADGYHLWSESHERDLKDVLAVQEEIAQAIVRTLRGRMHGEAGRLVSGPANVEAYNLYLKGRYFWYKWTPEGVQKSIEYFQQAVALDPNYAQAQAGLADAYGVLGHWGVVDPREYASKRDAALRRALEIDENLAEARLPLAMKKAFYEWDWAGAEHELRRVITISPRWAEGHRSFGAVLIAMGRFEDAHRELEQALALDPLSEFLNSTRGSVYYNQRRYDEAIELSTKAIEMHPAAHRAYLLLGESYDQKGLFPEAIRALQEAHRLAPGNTEIQAGLAHAYSRAGRRREAEKVLRELEERSAQRRVSPVDFATVFLGLGDKSRALDCLERALRERDGRLIRLKVSPVYDVLRSEPRYRTLLKRIGLST